jgi:hypothetical protein
MTALETAELLKAEEYLNYWRPQLRLDHIDFEIVFATIQYHQVSIDMKT